MLHCLACDVSCIGANEMGLRQGASIILVTCFQICFQKINWR